MYIYTAWPIRMSPYAIITSAVLKHFHQTNKSNMLVRKNISDPLKAPSHHIVGKEEHDWQICIDQFWM